MKYSSKTLTELREALLKLNKTGLLPRGFASGLAEKHSLEINHIRNALKGNPAKDDVIMAIITETESIFKIRPNKSFKRKLPNLTVTDLYDQQLLPAKYLDIRYIEPWPYEFQHQTNDSLIQDFNMWADAHFSPTDTCSFLTATTNPTLSYNELVIYPNPTNGLLNIKIDFPYKELKVTIFNLNGQKVLTATNQTELDISQFPKGLYCIKLNIDNKEIHKSLMKIE